MLIKYNNFNLETMIEMSEISANNRSGMSREAIHSVSISWTNIQVLTKTKKSIYNCFQTNETPKEIIRNGIWHL